MPSTINASNTTGGVITTGDGSGILQLQSGGTTALTINGANVTIAGTLATGGALPISSGGTNATATPTAGAVAYGTGTAYAFTNAGTSGQSLISSGSGAPTWGIVSPSISATASGAITAGNPVVINSDGTVSAVSGRGASSSSITQFTSNGTPPNFIAAPAYDTANDKVVIVYCDPGNVNYYGTYNVVTISGSTLSIGTTSNFISKYITFPKIVYDPVSAKMIIIYGDGSNIFRYIVGTVSGSTMTMGTEGTIASVYASSFDIVYDTANSKVVVLYNDSTNTRLRSIVGTVSGTTVSWGSPVDVIAGTSGNPVALAYVGSGKVVAVFNNSLVTNYLHAAVGTVSGTSISFGTAVQIVAYNSSYYACTYDSGNDRVAVSYLNASSGGSVAVGTVSGTSISFGTAVQFSATLSSYCPIVYEPLTGFVSLSYRGTSNYAYYQTGKVSGTSITFGTASTAFTTSIGTDFGGTYAGGATAAGFFTFPSASSNGRAFWGKGAFTNLTSTNFIGFSRATYANAATATVDVIGSVNSGQSGLTTGSPYYVLASGTGALTTSSSGNYYAGIATSATSILVKG